METAKAGQLMSLAALQRQDPYINKLLDVTGQVALYNFNSKANEWEKTDIEGTLFVYERSASPHHGFTIMNRLSTENLVEPINKDLEFQQQDPFLLYRNASLGIYSIWFYDKKDCQRIAQLMVKIVKQEADCAHGQSPERAGPSRTNGIPEPRPIDILELLSKAKDEYHRIQTGEMNVSATTEPSVMAALTTAEHVHSKPQPEKSSHTIVKQITVEELFGSSLTKDPSLPVMPTHSTTTATPNDPSNPGPQNTYLQGQPYAPPGPLDPLLPPHFTAAEPGASHRQLPPSLLPSPTSSYGLRISPVFQTAGSEPQPRCPVSPLVGQEMLSAVKQAPPSMNSDVHKPVLAPNFLPSALVPPHSFQEPIVKPLLQKGKDIDDFSKLPNLIKPMAGVPVSPGLALSRMGPALLGPAVSLLMSPSAFQHSAGKAGTELPKMAAASAGSAPPGHSDPPSSVVAAGAEPLQSTCSKMQLQQTLIHLIKNDAAFLCTIHDAYLRSLSKDFNHMKL